MIDSRDLLFEFAPAQFVGKDLRQRSTDAGCFDGMWFEMGPGHVPDQSWRVEKRKSDGRHDSEYSGRCGQPYCDRPVLCLSERSRTHGKHGGMAGKKVVTLASGNEVDGGCHNKCNREKSSWLQFFDDK